MLISIIASPFANQQAISKVNDKANIVLKENEPRFVLHLISVSEFAAAKWSGMKIMPTLDDFNAGVFE